MQVKTTSTILTVGMSIILVSAVINLVAPRLGLQATDEQADEIARLHRERSEAEIALAKLRLYKDVDQTVRTKRGRLAAGETMTAPSWGERAITDALRKSLKDSEIVIQPSEGVAPQEKKLKDRVEELSRKVAELLKKECGAPGETQTLIVLIVSALALVPQYGDFILRLLRLR